MAGDGATSRIASLFKRWSLRAMLYSLLDTNENRKRHSSVPFILERAGSPDGRASRPGSDSGTL